MNIKHEDTVYIVSGFMRTGTSMMMRALEVGGMEACHKQTKDSMRSMYKDEMYDPNEGGLYELEKQDYHVENFPDMYKGKLIKVLNLGHFGMKKMDKIKVIYMKRDPEEIRQSHEAFFGIQNINREKMQVHNIQRAVDENLEILRLRKDVDLLEFWFRDVVENPVSAFNKIKESGWPIDTEVCVKEVDPTLLRFKKEKLTEGI